ncbi:MAG: PilZ domain-containing protein [Myxococcota bacterium]|nr:PilZ domain-containing protein [Myxococcota bacterium]
MSKTRKHIIALENGQNLQIQLDTQAGSMNTRGKVIYVGSHHFRVRCKSRLPVRRLEPNQDVKISLTERKGVLPITTRFVRVLEKDPRVVILRLPTGEWQRNRRAFFRGEMVRDITVLRRDGSRIHGKTINVSGGGALIHIGKPLNIREEVQIAILFDNKETVTVRARVIRLNESPEMDKFGIKFVDITNRDRNYICRLVLVGELEGRRAELRELTGRTAPR